MLWRVSERRLPILILAYAFALQAIVAGWSGALHGPGLAADALFDALCRPSATVLSLAGETSSPSDPLPVPSRHHDCALACLNALGGGSFALAQDRPLPDRDASGAAIQSISGVAFSHLRVVSAAFAARAPPHLI